MPQVTELREGGEEEDYTDTASSISQLDDEEEEDELLDILDETLVDRVVALQDMLSPAQRQRLGSLASSTRGGLQWLAGLSARAGFVVASSALLLGVPLALSIVDEQQVMAMEKEMRLQQGANELLAPGASNQYSRF